jgi:hypothetical protein
MRLRNALSSHCSVPALENAPSLGPSNRGSSSRRLQISTTVVQRFVSCASAKSLSVRRSSHSMSIACTGTMEANIVRMKDPSIGIASVDEDVVDLSWSRARVSGRN